MGKKKALICNLFQFHIMADFNLPTQSHWTWIWEKICIVSFHKPAPTYHCLLCTWLYKPAQFMGFGISPEWKTFGCLLTSLYFHFYFVLAIWVFCINPAMYLKTKKILLFSFYFFAFIVFGKRTGYVMVPRSSLLPEVQLLIVYKCNLLFYFLL